MEGSVLVLRKFTEIIRGEGACFCNYFQMAQKKRERGEQKGGVRKGERANAKKYRQGVNLGKWYMEPLLGLLFICSYFK